jgi:hypothetical protein
MNKSIKTAVLAAVIGVVGYGSASAFSFSWVPGISSEPPTAIGGCSVLEYANAGNPYDGSAGNQWAVSAYENIWGDGAWSMWMMNWDPNTYASATLSTPSTDVAFAMEGDSNDGIAAFYVDGEFITSQDLYQLGEKSLIVSGLAGTTGHTLMVVQTGQQDLFSAGNHVHILGGAALGTCVPDGGSTVGLLLLGVASLWRVSRRAV